MKTINQQDQKGKIQTVTGVLDPESLGPTLMHEHILFDLTRPEVASKARSENIEEVTIGLQNVWEINRRSILD